MKNLIGILTVFFTMSLLIIVGLILSQGIMFKAFLVKLGMFSMSALVVLCGFYLVNTHCHPSKLARISIWIIGALVLLLGILVSFDIIGAKSTWNLLLGTGIVYITLVQLQLLKWEKSRNVLKIFGFLTLVSNIFVATYFLILLTTRSLGSILDVAVVVSVFSFLSGLILSRKKSKSPRLRL